MTYPEAIQYLESFINYEKVPAWPYKESLKLARIKDFLTAIGDPQEGLRCLHVAGTKGKGSTCAFLTYILRQAGFKVGLYTSPHLVDFRERIRILNPKSAHGGKKNFEGMISRAKLANLVQRLRPSIEKYNRHSQYSPLSFFEVYTALAFIYFKQKKIDFAVLETGLGGRLDATNVVYPLVAAITPVSYEHTQKLGNTLTEIAGEKAGIIKRQKAKGKRKNLIVITAPQVEEAMKVIRKKCKQVGARLYEVGKDITYQKRKDGFSVKGIFGEYSDLKIRLLGDHQLINATLATAIAQTLRFYNIDIGITSIRDGLYNTLWPGRCEVVAEEPAVIIDGAQNIASSRALKETIKEKFKYKRLILILGISKDKDIEGICRELRGLVDKVILTKANNPRASNPEELARYFPGKDVYITYSVKEAKKKAWALADKQDLILITGSLFVVGEVRGDLG